MRRLLFPVLIALSLGACDLNDFRRTPVISGNDFAAELDVNPEDMQRTPSGLRYEDLVTGTGPDARPGSEVAVHYTGWLTDGTQFDSSVGGEPFVFPLGAGRVIAGWDEGVAGMRVGGQRTLLIPAAYGYGSRGAGRVIPPGASLVFEVELLDVAQP